jgi:hypothetical protein
MSEFQALNFLNNLHAQASTDKEERELLLDGISCLFDHGISPRSIEDIIIKSDFNHSLNNY